MIPQLRPEFLGKAIQPSRLLFSFMQVLHRILPKGYVRQGGRETLQKSGSGRLFRVPNRNWVRVLTIGMRYMSWPFTWPYMNRRINHIHTDFDLRYGI